ncbi:MAG: CehA/McbA family metallohydrolase [Planctomycetota bacterium]|jgi:hypothetical protein
MANPLKQLQQRRREYLETLTGRDKRDMGVRIAASRKFFKTKLATADLHSHSKYSDGQSSVAENAARAKLVGIDMLFATDHGRITQKRDVANLPNATWGEESHSGGFDMGLLQPTKVHKYKPGESTADGFARGRAVSPFVWAAHPVGFSPVGKKSFKLVFERLCTIDNLAMEVLNGFDAMRSYYRTGVWGVRMMDAVLQAGRTVTPVGVSDAHFLVEIGNSWTGVIGATKSPTSIIKGLQEGRAFASEAPLLELKANGKLMGSTLKPKKGSAIKLRFRAADSFGLNTVRIISDGKVMKEIHAKGDSFVEASLTRKATGHPTYYRLECTANDDRRAFSAPIYVR